MTRKATTGINYQERALQFSVGDVVYPYGSFADNSGRVTAVWPAIGMVDVEFPIGNRRHPVEDLQRIDADGNVDPPKTNSVAGGHTVYVSGGPMSQQKQALYWAGPDRRYRMTKTEQDCGKLDCPKCGSDYPLRKAVYKRRDGSSERLMGCPNCMFLIKTSDIINFQSEKEDVTVKIEVKV